MSSPMKLRFHIVVSKVLFSILLLTSFAARSQYIPNPAELSVPATTPGSFYNEKSITLKDGFIATATTTNSYTYSISCGVPLAIAPSANQNYIITSVPRVSGMTGSGSLSNRTTCELMQTVQYFDGLGRPLQTVQVKGSGGQAYRDVVQPVAYDRYGRETNKYLPYTASSATSNGSYKASAIADQALFYNSPVAGVGGIPVSNGITPSFAQTIFEASPLNRVTEQGAAGADWQPVSGNTSGHTIKIQYSSNTSGVTDTTLMREVVLYTISSIDPSTQARTLSIGTGGKYDAGQLYVTVSKDENWKNTGLGNSRGGTTEEYKDKEGHVVLKRTFLWTGTTLQALSTYYVYDDLGNLAYVFPPLSGADGTMPDQTKLDNLCYQYRYDERNRLTQKKLPGKGWEYLVYNKLDQPVLTQDALQRLTNQWTVTKYDALGRVIITGVWNAGSAIPLSTLQASVYSAAQWDVSNRGDNVTGYTVSSYPGPTKVLTINYYDNYNIPGMPTTYIPPGTYSQQTKGLLTATKTAVLNTISDPNPDMLWSVNYYDEEGRSIINYKQHYLGGHALLSANNYDRVETIYNFTDQPTEVIRYHYKNSSNSPVLAVTVTNDYEYDHMGRKTNSWEQIQNGTKTLLSKLEYNEIGQLWQKHLHSTTGSAFKQDITYSYNERGWLTKMNDPNTVTSAQVFGEQLQYNDGTTPQYNGNISGSLWQIMVPPGYNLMQQKQSYSYKYDQLNRLTLAGYTTPGTLNKFNEQLSYDLMGNISSLKRTNTTVPNQYLNYFSNYDYTTGGAGNKLWSVTDNGTAAQSSTYLYDLNGNVTKDTRNQITNITYNLLNLPSLVSRTPGNITYVYDASGGKLQKISGGITRDYIGGIEYNNNTLEFISTEEGRATPSGNTYFYSYYFKDHLGNTRAAIGQDGSILQVQDYYAFGMEMATGNSFNSALPQQYKYNGKELQAETGQYDYGARFYDPVIGRFASVDPLTNQRDWLSPYNYVRNNPMVRNDPTGTIDNYIFDELGNFNRRERNNQPDKLVIENKAGARRSYNFNDPENDVRAINNAITYRGKVGINRVAMLSDQSVEMQIVRSGVRSENAQESPISYAKEEGARNMDYGVKGITGGDLNPKSFYIREGTAYNVGDIGNYLWGRGMAELGIELGTAKLGAHWNNLVNGSKQTTPLYNFGPGTYGSPGWLDSPGDQRAITNGYLHSPKGAAINREATEKTKNQLKYGQTF